MRSLKFVLAAGTLLGSTTAFAASYSATGAGSSTVGSGGDYPTLADACTAVRTAGTRDASAWTFSIISSTTETANSDLRCTVASGGSITFKPATGVRPVITWPNTIAANAGTSGHFVVGASISGAGYLSTNNITVDGSNTIAGSTRDLVFQTQNGDTEVGLGMFRVRGNCDNFTIKNCVFSNGAVTNSTQQTVTFTSDGATADANKCPDNWTVDNCQFSVSTLSSGNTANSSIACGSSGTVTSQAQTGWSITNNIITGGARAIYLPNNGSGVIRGNTIHTSQNGGYLGATIYHSGSNSTTGWTITVDKNFIDHVIQGTPSAGDFGNVGIFVAPVAGACTINITNNMIGGFIYATPTAAVDSTYQGIRVSGGNASGTVNIEHNTINMPSLGSSIVTGGTAGRVAAINRTAATPPVMNLKSNLIRFTQAGTNAYAIYAASSASITAAGNCIYAAGTNVARLNATTYASFGPAATAGTWQNAGFDTGGQSVDPSSYFAVAAANSGNNLHFNATPSGLATTGQTTALSTDIDGDTRATDGTALPGADVASIPTPTTYTWNVAGGGDYSTAANWSPVRTSPKWSDTLVFDGAITPGVLTITDVQDQHLAGLKLINSANVAMGALGGYSRLFVWNGDAGATADFQVGAGSALTMGSTGLIIDLQGGGTGSVSGDVVVHSSQSGITNRILSKTVGGLVFNNGGTAAHLPSVSSTGAMFGGFIPETALNGVTFASGATFHHGATKAGVRGASSPSNPFAYTAPSAAASFASGSSYVYYDGSPTLSGRTYGNLTWKGSSSASSTGGSALTVQNDFTVSPSGAATTGTLTVGLTFGAGTAVSVGGNLTVEAGSGGLTESGVPAAAASNFNVAGNVDIQDAALFTPNANTNRVYQLNGTSAQSLNLNGDSVGNLTVNNSAGVNLAGNATVTNQLVLTAGLVNTGAFSLTIPDGASAVTRTAGAVFGNPVRNLTLTTLGQRLFPVADALGNYVPVTLDITAAGTGTGSLLVKSVSGAHPDLLAGNSVSRYWTLTPTSLAGVTASLTFQYLAGDITGGTESTYVVGSWDGSDWTAYPASTTIDTLNHTATVTGVTSFSDWTVAEHVALPVSISGFSID